MPFDVKVLGISKADGEVLFTIEPVWWDERKLRSNRRFKLINKDPGYRDYNAELSVDQLKKFHEQFRPEATAGVYKCEGWQERIQPIMKELDEALYDNSDQYTHFRVQVFEWESGF